MEINNANLARCFEESRLPNSGGIETVRLIALIQQHHAHMCLLICGNSGTCPRLIVINAIILFLLKMHFSSGDPSNSSQTRLQASSPPSCRVTSGVLHYTESQSYLFFGRWRLWLPFFFSSFIRLLGGLRHNSFCFEVQRQTQPTSRGSAAFRPSTSVYNSSISSIILWNGQMDLPGFQSVLLSLKLVPMPAVHSAFA